MRKLLAICLLGFSSLVTAQTVQTTPNLITSGTNHTWTGVQTGAIPANYMPGGPTPKYDPATNIVQFSYGQATVAQTIAINNALANVGAGVKVNGYNYSYDARNMNGDDRQGSIDTFTVTTKMTSNTGSTLLSTSTTHNTKFDWTTFSGTQTAQTPYDVSGLGQLQFSVTGKDSGYWAGYFGPQIRNVNMSLNYGVDPCATNPAYSPNCANYNTVSFSNNLVPNPTAYATYGSSIDQSYAINQALGQAGAGATIHGFQWGYTANANGAYCAFWLIVCLDNRTPSVTTNVDITDSNGSSLYAISRTYTGSYNTTSYQYLFPSSRSINTLGRFNFTATTNDAAYVGDVWSKAVYTPNPCAVDPLSSTSCPGYAAAYMTQQCTANPLYNSSCPGYAQAFLTQQCTANQLYSPSCPGYASAYLDYQCSVNPLYSTQCAGYETAYFNQQCSLNPLYNSRCTGYQQAYHDQQCSLNPLYASDCTGYTVAYHDQQCGINPLYASDCIGYQQAYLTQQCNINPLYSTQCTGYAAAYKSQQCSLNPLYATDCPGYAQAYFNQQCSLNGLYDRTCPNYSEAYAKANILNVSASSGTSTTTATATTVTTTTASVALATSTDVAATVAPVVADPVVNSVVTTKSTSTTADANPAAAVKLIAKVDTVTSPVVAETKKEEVKKNDSSTNNSSTSSDNKPSDQPKSNREALAERRRESAQKEAVAKAKDLANEMGKAADLEAQKAVQNVVIQAMGFTPGFDAYGKASIPDANSFYKPYQVYGGQANVDNRFVGRRLMGGSEALHQQMIDSQFNLGDK